MLALLAVATAWAFQTAAESYARQQLQNLLQDRLGTTVEIAAVELAWLPLGARIVGLTVTAADGLPLAEVDEVVAEARWRDLRANPRRLHTVRVVRPRLFLRVAEDGSNNLPVFAFNGGNAMVLETLEVTAGEFVLDEKSIPLEFALQELRLRAGGAEDKVFAGSIQAAEVVIALPTGTTYSGALAARATWGEGGLVLVDGLLSGPDLRLQLGAGSYDPATRRWRCELSAAGDVRLLDQLGLDAAELEGRWHFAGKIEGEQAWRAAGRLTSDRLAWGDLGVSELSTEIVASPEQVELSGLSVRFGGARLEGSITASWSDSARPVEVRLSARDGQLAALAADLGLELPGLSGQWSAETRYLFDASDAVRGYGEAAIELLLVDAEQNPLWARPVTVSLSGGEARFVTTGDPGEGERLSLSGRYALDERTGEVDFELETERLAAWLAVAVAGADPGLESWLPATGSGSVQGVAAVGPGSWSSRFGLDLDQVKIGALEVATLEGALTVSSSGVRDMRLNLSRPEGAMIVAGSLLTASGEQTARLDLNVEVDGWPAAEVARQLELPIAIDGPLVASASLTGSTEGLEGSVELEVRPATAGGMEMEAISGRVEIAPDGVRLAPLEVQLAGGVVTVGGWLPLAGFGLEMTLESTPLDVALLPFAAALPPDTDGTVTARGTIGGSAAEPELALDLSFAGLSVAGDAAIGAETTQVAVRWAGGQLTTEGAIGDFLLVGGGGELSMEAAELEISLASERVGALLSGLLPAGIEGVTGAFTGRLALYGRFDSGQLAPELRLDVLELNYGDRRLSALEPVAARWSDGALEIDSLFLGDAQETSEIFVFGHLPFAEDDQLELKIQAAIDSSWFELALPDWELVNGRFDLLASVAGSLSQPLVNGQGELRQESVALPGMSQQLEELRAVLLFYPGEIVIDEAEARFAGGTLRAAGNATPYTEQGVEYRLQLAAEGLQLRYPEGWQLRSDAELVLASTVDGRQLRGRVTVDRALFTDDLPVGITQFVQGALARRPELVEETDELLATTQLNIAVSGPEALRVRNNVADLRGAIDLVVRGNLAQPVVFGDVRIEPGGTLVYAGSEYDVRRAELNFVNPYRLEPVIDLEATTRSREYDITLILAGTLERLDVELVSNPPLANLDVLALLAGGEQPIGDSAGGADSGGPGVAESFLYGQAASAVAKRVNRLFGLDKFRIDPLTGDSGNISSARVTFGKQLSRDLFATYSYDPTLSELGILQIEWQVSRQLTLVATQNGDGSYALDTRWEKSF